MDSGSHTRKFYSETSTSTSVNYGGCRTRYDVTSSAPPSTPNGFPHNCNDDSSLQINAITSNASQNTSAGVCNDPTGHGYAPSCG